MGKQIVYCVGCGNSLRESDFDEGRAINHENRPYCENCKPKNLPTESPSKAQPGPARKTSTSRIPTQRPATARKMQSGRMPRDAQTDRRRPVERPTGRRKNPNWPLIIGGITLAVAFILLLLVVVFRRERPGARPPVDPPAPTQKP